jgi:hypothetical protein
MMSDDLYEEIRQEAKRTGVSNSAIINERLRRGRILEEIRKIIREELDK